MSFELEDKEDIIVVDLNNKAIKGYCKARDWKKHFKKVKDVFND